MVLSGFFFAPESTCAASFDVIFFEGRAAWRLPEADGSVEIEVVVPFVDPSRPIDGQLAEALSDAPFRRKLLVKGGTVFKAPRDFLPKMTDQERAAYPGFSPAAPKRIFAGWRMLGYYLLLRPEADGRVKILARANRSFAPVDVPVPVQSGDIFMLIELAGCL